MLKQIPDGVYPTMLTPYTLDNKIDFNALEQLIYWYAERGVAGLFAICQSSEIFYLSFSERLAIIDFIMKHKPDNLTVIASGHTADDLDTQVSQAQEIIATGIDAYVFISNRFAKRDESDDVLLKNMFSVIDRLPDIPFGVYECPYPYKRLLSPYVMKEMARSGKFAFLKDTCCNIEQIKEKLSAVEGSSLKIYNANCALLLESLDLGCSGFSGVMANFHPELYVELCNCYKSNHKRAELIQDFVGFASLAECQAYPINAKYSISLDGVEITSLSRARSSEDFPRNRQVEIEQMHRTTALFKQLLK